jgi:hypothetical protein
MIIRRLLAEAGSAGAGQDVVSVGTRAGDATADWDGPRIAGKLHRL